MIKVEDLNLRNMDIIFTTSLYPIACCIRKAETGKWLDMSIATHVGIVFEHEGYWLIAEMLPSGIELSSLKKYLNDDSWFGARIIEVRRCNLWENLDVQHDALEMIWNDYFNMTEYDFRGVLEYVLPFLKDKDTDYYCSEYVNQQAIKQGFNLVGKGTDENCTPYDLQKTSRLKTVWKKG